MDESIYAEIICVSKIQPEPIEWLWPGFIACGKLSVIMGDPGLGKSLVTLDLAARVTKGFPWPVNNGLATVGDVLLLSIEDDPADTIRPRLDAAGADNNRVHLLTFIREESDEGTIKRCFSLQNHITELHRFLCDHQACKLIVIDPISSYLGGVNGNDNIEVRSVLAPLANLAQIHKVAIVFVTHLNKSEHRTSLNRMAGSVAFGALVRFVFSVVKDAKNSSRRLMLQSKNNLAEDAKGLAYTIKNVDEIPVIEWEQEYVSMSVEEAFSYENKQKTSEIDEASEWLRNLLSNGRMQSKDVTDLATVEGFSVATLRRAKKKLGICSKRESFGEDGIWWFELPKVLNHP